MEIIKIIVFEVFQSFLMLLFVDISIDVDDGEFQEQYDIVMKEVIVFDNSLVNKG